MSSINAINVSSSRSSGARQKPVKLPPVGHRLHGFEPPFDPHQMGSWFVFGIIVISHCVLYVPLQTDAVGIVLTVIWAILALGVVVSNVRCCRTNPADPALQAKRLSAADPVAGAAAAAKATTSHYCRMCAISVHATSKHCRRCDKCVIGFDHHCPWLNTCVGALNYKYFLALLVSTFAVSTVQLCTTIQLGVLVTTSASFQQRLATLYGMPPMAYGLLLVVSCVLLVLTWLLIVQLGTFHIALMSRVRAPRTAIPIPAPPSSPAARCTRLVSLLANRTLVCLRCPRLVLLAFVRG